MSLTHRLCLTQSHLESNFLFDKVHTFFFSAGTGDYPHSRGARYQIYFFIQKLKQLTDLLVIRCEEQTLKAL